MKHPNEVTADNGLLNGKPIVAIDQLARKASQASRRKIGKLTASLVVAGCLTLTTQARAQFGDIFQKIFSSIQTDMGGSLKAVNQITQQVSTLYQTTMWPLAALNQARGFVSNSISSFRGQMSQIFTTKFSSATLTGPQQFESILHSRLSTQIPSLQSSFTTTFGAVPQANTASPQDRVMMDIDDALAQQNLKTTLVADQAQDLLLQTADQMENQVALSTPGSNPYITAQAQLANLRAQAYMQKMLAAELRQEAGRIAHDNVLAKRRSTSTTSINGLINGVLTPR
jgi:hypothetical protein